MLRFLWGTRIPAETRETFANRPIDQITPFRECIASVPCMFRRHFDDSKGQLAFFFSLPQDGMLSFANPLGTGSYNSSSSSCCEMTLSDLCTNYARGSEMLQTTACMRKKINSHGHIITQIFSPTNLCYDSGNSGTCPHDRLFFSVSTTVHAFVPSLTRAE